MHKYATCQMMSAKTKSKFKEENRKRCRGSSIPDGVREGSIHEKVPKRNKKTRFADIWEGTIRRRDFAAETYLVYVWKARRPGGQNAVTGEQVIGSES